ncbi:MAG TPA: Clp protease N-terminal domain-containing protein, partial [Acidimicrobiia bacterium]|nr:Clp protease N-terminal domain-containing protein [Acidimicrobiia bacterium]
MDLNRLTEKSQQALSEAQSSAIRLGHTEVDGEHLLLALLTQPEGLVPRLVTQAGGDPARLVDELESDLAQRPRVSGSGLSPGEIRVTRRLAQLLEAAEREARQLKDEYVSVEHLVIAFLGERDDTAAKRSLTSQGITRDGFLGALTAVRGNQRVTSATPEAA